LFAAKFTEGDTSGRVPYAGKFELSDVDAAGAVMDAKVRMVRLVLNQANDFQPNTEAKDQHLLDLGLVCGELSAIVGVAGQHVRIYQSYAISALTRARAALLEAYNYLTEQAKQRPPMEHKLPLNPNKAYWEVTPLSLYYVDWGVIGQQNIVSADRPASN
jgi:hypothetical protein